MKKTIIIILLLILTSCSKSSRQLPPNQLMLSIKNYTCKMQLSYFSNKNTTEYSALQNYNSTGVYSMEFLDNENFKIIYDKNSLSIFSLPLEISKVIFNHPEKNENPLFLSYFINTYFNTENINNIAYNENKISLVLPENNNYLYSATLAFKNNIPYTLSYFDKNGNLKVNIIYNEFNSYST